MAKKAPAAPTGVEFYDVKTRQKVSVDEGSIAKTTFTTSSGQVRYALRGTLGDKRVLTRFVSKADWDAASYKEAKPAAPAKAAAKPAAAAAKPAAKPAAKKK